MDFSLDYDKMLFLDAEELAEAGIKRAYDFVVDNLKHHASDLAEVQEIIDNDAQSYVVKCRGLEYVIYSPAISHDESWGRATYALFTIVNDQLIKTNHRFYAINSGNDLGGMFLTASEGEAVFAASGGLALPADAGTSLVWAVSRLREPLQGRALASLPICGEWTGPAPRGPASPMEENPVFRPQE